MPLELIPYLPEAAVPFLQSYAQLVGALFPVTTFAYKNKPVIKLPATCQVTTLATVEHDILSALGELAKAVGAPAQPAARLERSKSSPPARAGGRRQAVPVDCELWTDLHAQACSL
jgi:acetolactate synthase-1/2/3 large subunit